MEPVKTLDQQLADNAANCDRYNIIVRVDRVNSKRNVAFCSVEQRHRGLFRRDRPSHYLAWQAEMALAPLRHNGITPLITVQEKSLGNPNSSPVRATPPSFMSRVRGLWNRPGASKSRVPVPVDPFGWRMAMNGCGGR